MSDFSVAFQNIARWRERPDIFVREVLGATPDAWQDEVLRAFPRCPRIALKASKGPGKSTLLGLIQAQFFRYPDAQVFTFDKGYSSFPLVAACGGHHYDIAAESIEALAFYPLAEIDRPAERSWAAEWVETLMTLQGVVVTPAHRGAIDHALGLLAASPSRTLTDLQVKLLRVLEERRIRRLGASRYVDIDVRFVSATNRDLVTEVAAGRFREDLYYRISGISLSIPPLRERIGEIEPLARHFLMGFCVKSGIAVPACASAAVAASISRLPSSAITKYAWPSVSPVTGLPLAT